MLDQSVDQQFENQLSGEVITDSRENGKLHVEKIVENSTTLNRFRKICVLKEKPDFCEMIGQ